AYRWPGNVRELRNMVAAAVATGRAAMPDVSGPAIDPDADGDIIARVLELEYKKARRIVTDAFETRYLRYLLSRTGGNIRAAAGLGAVDRNYLSDLLKRYGLR